MARLPKNKNYSGHLSRFLSRLIVSRVRLWEQQGFRRAHDIQLNDLIVAVIGPGIWHAAQVLLGEFPGRIQCKLAIFNDKGSLPYANAIDFFHKVLLSCLVSLYWGNKCAPMHRPPMPLLVA